MENIISDVNQTHSVTEDLRLGQSINENTQDEKITAYLIQSTVDEDGVVRVWEEDILLPTYQIGEEEKIRYFLKNVFIREVLEQYIRIL